MKYNLSNIPNFLDIINDNVANISNRNITYNNSDNYKIIKYNKNYLSFDLINVYGLLKSVVVSNENKRLLAFSPPKTMTASEFMSKYPVKTENIVAEEFVEGTMINVFYDESRSKWEISTRNNIGANTRFYTDSKLTFHEMFMEACNECGLNIDNLNQLFCYSFVLQHEENRIVTKFNTPSLYLIGAYSIEQNDNTIFVNEEDLTEIIKGISGGVRLPTRYDFENYTELISKFASKNTHYTTMGIIVRNVETGEFTKFRNPNYEEVRQLRGNQAKLQYQYLLLRKEGKVNEYLKFYPDAKPEFSLFREQIHTFTGNLHANYVGCFVKKEQKLEYYSDRYKYHMYSLHRRYIDELMPKKQFVTHTEVIKYVNNLHPSVLMHSLNYNIKKNRLKNRQITQSIYNEELVG
jgi:hypothetical protein